MDKVQLAKQIDRYFDLEDLRALCFELGVDYDSLRGEGKAAQARELVLLMERTGRINELAQLCASHRPNVDWDAGPVAPTPAQSPAQTEAALKMARRALAILEEQAAGYTALTVPVHLKIELEEKRREVAALEGKLGRG